MVCACVCVCVVWITVCVWGEAQDSEIMFSYGQNEWNHAEFLESACIRRSQLRLKEVVLKLKIFKFVSAVAQQVYWYSGRWISVRKSCLFCSVLNKVAVVFVVCTYRRHYPNSYTFCPTRFKRSQYSMQSNDTRASMNGTVCRSNVLVLLRSGAKQGTFDTLIRGQRNDIQNALNSASVSLAISYWFGIFTNTIDLSAPTKVTLTQTRRSYFAQNVS